MSECLKRWLSARYAFTRWITASRQDTQKADTDQNEARKKGAHEVGTLYFVQLSKIHFDLPLVVLLTVVSWS